MKIKYLILSILFLSACQNNQTSNSVLDSTFSNTSNSNIELTNAMIQELQNNLYLEGHGSFEYVSLDYQDDNYTSDIQVCFNDDSFISNEKTSNNVIYSSKIIKRNNQPYTYFINENNEISYLRAENASKQASWDDFSNPFKKLTVDNFVKTNNDNEYMIKNSKTTNDVAKVISGYPITFKTFKILLDDSKIKQIIISGQGQDSYFVDLNMNFVFEIKDLNKINSKPETYTRTPMHDKLDEAFDNTLNCTFTIIHKDHHEIYGDTIYRYYFTESAIYCDRPEIGDETYPFGYVALADGVYKFSNTKAEGLVKEYKVGESIFDFYPKFKNFNSAIVKPIDENNFVNYDSDNASIIGKYIAENSEETIFSKAANELSIQLSEQKISQITYYYSLLGGFTTGEVTMDFVNYNKTTIPLNFKAMKDRNSILD